MTLTPEFYIQVIIYVGTFGFTVGTVLTRLNAIEKKLDKHNGLIERMVVVEQNVKASWRSIDEIKENMKGIG